MYNNFSTGIAFPCCISVNNCICHYSPLTHDADTVLKEGDLAKIDLGAHIDGFIAVVAHTGNLRYFLLFRAQNLDTILFH